MSKVTQQQWNTHSAFSMTLDTRYRTHSCASYSAPWTYLGKSAAVMYNTREI